MKAVLISIQPKWCELIANGSKTIEVRKTKPKLKTPFKVYIYETKGYDTLFGKGKPKKLCVSGGRVIGEFVCDELTGGFWISPFSDYLQRQSCLSYDEVCDYANEKPIFAWHISNLVIYDRPKELGEFRKPCENELYCESCAMYSEYERKCGNVALQFKRPPQSWCYIEQY